MPETLTITQNGTYTPQQAGTGYSEVIVDVDAGFEPDDFASGSVRTELSGNITLNTATTISARAFFKFSQITSITAPNITSTEDYALTECSALTSFIAPKLTSLGPGGFANLTNLTNVSLPSYRYTRSTSIFEGCSNLPLIVLPSLGRATDATTDSILNTSFFKGCSKLEVVDFYGIGFGSRSFTNCTMLDKIILRNKRIISSGSGICGLDNIDVFNGTPFASGGTGGTLYVPQRYISNYQSATNWSTILGYANNQILPIEGSYYETHYADGTAYIVPTYTEISFTRIEGRLYNPNDGGYSSAAGGHATDYITTSGNKTYQFTSPQLAIKGYVCIQQFNGDEYLGTTSISNIDVRNINGTDYYAETFVLYDNCTRFRFSLNGRTIQSLYLVTTA